MFDLKKPTGRVSIGRPQGGGKEVITIEIMDDVSRVTFVHAELDYESFTRLITGQAHIPCEFYTRGLDLIGTTAENKVERVTVPQNIGRRDSEAAAKLLAPYEVDGWIGDRDDLWNHHRGSQGVQRVTFRRHVRADGTPVIKGVAKNG